MKILKIYPTSINMRFVGEAVTALEDGEIIVYPTDTLYALGCDALNNRSIERLCHLKGINPQKENLSIVCADISQASEYARIDNRAFSILKRYLPGPYTFILPAATTLPKVFKGRKTVGVRIPDNDITRCLAETLGHPMLSTSVTGEAASMGEPEEIALAYSEVAAVMVDGGTCAGLMSTVVDLTDSSSPEIVRQGAGEFEA